MTKLLIVFCKNPELGKVKTRLARTLGDNAALAIYLKLLRHTREVVDAVKADIAVYYSDYIDHEDDWNKNYLRRLQHGEDIGDKMYNAISEGLEMGYESVCLIGADIYALTSDVIRAAFETLHKKDIVIGPAEDGGYYLIGMKKATKKVFELSKWSHHTVITETLGHIKALNASYGLVDKLNDIDEEDDLQGTDLLSVASALKS